MKNWRSVAEVSFWVALPLVVVAAMYYEIGGFMTFFNILVLLMWLWVLSMVLIAAGALYGIYRLLLTINQYMSKVRST